MSTLWGIRHLRYWFYSWCFWRWWDLIGREYWMCPNPNDLEYLQEIWDGKR